MKLIKPSFDIIEQSPDLNGIYKIIEIAGRTCYKSSDKITPDSAEAFVDRMIASGHGAMLEHGTVYLKIVDNPNTSFRKYQSNKYSKCNRIKLNFSGHDFYYITSNYRILVENGWLEDLQYLCEPTEFHEKRISVKFICDRGVSHKIFVA